MSAMGMIVSIISLIACLILATRSAPFRALGARKAVRYAAIWAAIIAGLVAVIRLTGLHIAP